MDVNPVVVMFSVIGIINIYMLFFMARIDRTLEKKVDAESLREKLELKDKLLDKNLSHIHERVNSLNKDVETFNASVLDLKEVVHTFSEEVLQIKKRLEDFTSKMRATLDNALARVNRGGL